MQDPAQDRHHGAFGHPEHTILDFATAAPYSSPMNRSATDAETKPLLYTLLGTAHRLEARLETALAEVGLSTAKLGVLTLLADAGEPLTLGDLAARQQCVRSNMTQLVDRLEAEGLVRRVPDPVDRRSIRATLTTEGEARQESGAACAVRLQEEFVETLPESDRAALRRILSGLSGS